MKKLVSFIVAISLLLCSAVTFAAEVQEVVIDTEVPFFKDLIDGSSYAPGKTVQVADLSKVHCVVLKTGNSTITFAGKTFSGYTQVAAVNNLECINYQNVTTLSAAGSYLVYATDIYGHDIAVRIQISGITPTPTPTIRPVVGGGGGGGGGGGIVTEIKAPFANGDPNNTSGTLEAGQNITLDTDTGNAKIYYTTNGSSPNANSYVYSKDNELILQEGQILKAAAFKSGRFSPVSEWRIVKATEVIPTPGSAEGTGSIVSGVLETDNHIVYMNGYPEGTFLPANNMTRAEVATMFSRLMKEKMVEGKVYESSFTDVQADAWYANAVGYIEQFGIINGYEDGTFRPQNTITRAEFVTMASRFATLSKEFDCRFADVDNSHWAYHYIAFAAGNKWVGGYEDNTFRADNTITRAEVVTIVNNMLVREADRAYVDANIADLTVYYDVDNSHWAYYEIMEATNAHTYTYQDAVETWQK